MNFRLTEALAQVHHRNDFAAKVYNPLDEVGGTGHCCDLRDADNLAHGGDAHTVRFVADPETNYLKVFFHQKVSGPLGTRQFGVCNLMLAIFLRTTALSSGFSAVKTLLAVAVKSKAVHAVEQIAGKLQRLARRKPVLRPRS